MPFQRIPAPGIVTADDVTAGTFPDDYAIAGLFTAGTPGGARVELGDDGSGPAVRVISADGTRMEMTSGATDRLHAYLAGVLKGSLIAGAAGIEIASPDENSYAQVINGAAALESDNTAIVSAPTTFLGKAGNNNTTVLSDSLYDHNGHPMPKWGGVNQRTINAAIKTGTTDGSGLITTNHSLPGTPIAVVAVLDDTATGFVVTVHSTTSTQVTFKVWTNSTTPATFITASIHWIAIG